ncbi:MAG: sigma-70 family RNA polymerase sigma factor [Woeseiaceae bacterium]|nr:sigma-70 family RNA polymerase sigma factor [Woeseiaceae bacterium]
MAAKPGMTESNTAKSAGDDALELALLRRIAADDRDALAELYRLYHGRLFKFTYRLTRSHPAADELVNDILLIVWQSAEKFRGESRVSTWIFGIAYRQAMRRLRRRKIWLLDERKVDQASADDTSAVDNEDWVRRGLAGLPAAQQLTIEFVFYLGLSYSEVADVMDCPVNTVKTRMFHARRKLRGILVQSADTDDTASEQDDDHGR